MKKWIPLFLICAIAPAAAGPERIAYPAAYAERFMQYNQIERPDRKPMVIRFMYVNREAADAARARSPVPEGAVLIMEDRLAAYEASGNPLRDANGRLVATDKVVNVFVQQKQNGWGEAYPADKRNGDWEYAWFNPDGTPRANAKTDGCFACHLSRAQRDYTFTFSKWVLDGKP